MQILANVSELKFVVCSDYVDVRPAGEGCYLLLPEKLINESRKTIEVVGGHWKLKTSQLSGWQHLDITFFPKNKMGGKKALKLAQNQLPKKAINAFLRASGTGVMLA